MLVLKLTTISPITTTIKNITSTTDQMAVIAAFIASLVLVASLVWSAVRAYRTHNTLQDVMVETAKATSLVFIILLGAAMLTAAFRAFGGEELVQHFLEGVPGGFWAKFFVVMLIMFILGFFLDFIEIAVVVVPIMAPILLADPTANVTAVWLGVMIGLNIQTSFLTPPFGFALFYLRGVAPAVVKTLDMYKGVIGFISLQLAALGIVAYYPALVNYLPNRVSLLSETAPPPRNPRLQYCVEEYVYERIVADTGPLDAAVARVQAVDSSFLPEAQQSDLTGTYEGIAAARQALRDAKAAEAAVENAAEEYRPIHRFVRGLERDARQIDGEVQDMETRLSRMRGDENADRRERLSARIAERVAERDALLAQIPEGWEARRDEFALLTKAEAQQRTAFRRAADGAYGDVVSLRETLAGGEEFEALSAGFANLDAQIAAAEGRAKSDVVKDFADQVGRVDGMSKVKSALSKVRRELRRGRPRADRWEADLAEAKALYAAQAEWRSAVTPEFVAALDGYAEAMEGTVGLRQQDRLPRDAALDVAACQSGHRDISLNF
ncbi:MAG: TRAP transporter large permease subunit [Pseudomonadota bacterium]